MASVFGIENTTVAADTAGAATEYVVASRAFNEAQHVNTQRRRLRAECGFRVPAIAAGSTVRVRQRLGTAGTTADTLVADSGARRLAAGDVFTACADVFVRTAGSSGALDVFAKHAIPQPARTITLTDSDTAATAGVPFYIFAGEGGLALGAKTANEDDTVLDSSDRGDSFIVKHMESLGDQSYTMTDDDSAASNGTALHVAISPESNEAYFASANAGSANSLFTAPASESSDDAVYVAYEASPGGVQVYFDEDGVGLVADLAMVTAGKDVTIRTVEGRRFIVHHDASASSNGVAVYFDDDAGNTEDRLLFVSPTDSDGTVTAESSHMAALIYIDEDAAGDSKLLANLSAFGADTVEVLSTTSKLALKVAHNGTPGTPGVQAYFDDDTAPTARLLFVSPTDASGTQSLVGDQEMAQPVTATAGVSADCTSALKWTTTVEFSDGTSSTSIEQLYCDVYAMPLSQVA